MRIAALVCALPLLADSGQTVPYPAGYRTWAVTRSFITREGPNAGFHHYYANPQALEGFTTGKFPDGAVLVDERLEVDQHEGGSFEGKRISIAVMRKDSSLYSETGGWGFDGTLGESQALSAPAAMRASCYACHSKQKDHDFVYSTFRK
ncbi:MAG TPA: cytochrome P460 family protein [Bryobacteraceae bacterium]|nr:cytochrome P460 family protein [Bryobacteraceae bacterium]